MLDLGFKKIDPTSVVVILHNIRRLRVWSPIFTSRLTYISFNIQILYTQILQTSRKTGRQKQNQLLACSKANSGTLVGSGTRVPRQKAPSRERFLWWLNAMNKRFKANKHPKSAVVHGSWQFLILTVIHPSTSTLSVYLSSGTLPTKNIQKTSENNLSGPPRLTPTKASEPSVPCSFSTATAQTLKVLAKIWLLQQLLESPFKSSVGCAFKLAKQD